MFVLSILAAVAVQSAASRGMPARSDIATAVAASGVADGCSANDVAAAVARAGVQRIGTLAGEPVVLIALQAPCLCGNVNCPYLVVQTRAGRRPKQLLATDAYDVEMLPASEVLPRLRESAHDSALIHIETVDAFRNGAYAPISVTRVRGDTGGRKPDTIPIHFAPGASSARLTGRVARDWNDVYTFTAAAKQRVHVAGVAPRNLALTLLPPDKTQTPSIEVHAGDDVMLPAGGTYRLLIESTSEQTIRYDLTLRIQ